MEIQAKNFSQLSLSLENEFCKFKSVTALLDLSEKHGLFTLPSLESCTIKNKNEYIEIISTEGFSVKENIIVFFEKVFELMKKVWTNFVSYMGSFGKMVRSFVGKIKNHVKMIFENRRTVIKLRDGLVQEATKLQEHKVKTDEDLKRKAEVFSEIIEKKQYFNDVETVDDIKRRLKTIVDEKVDFSKVDLNNIRYTLEQDDFSLFGYNKYFNLFDTTIFKYHKTIADHYLHVALETRRIFEPDTLITKIMNIGKQYNKIETETFRTKLIENYIEEYLPLYSQPRLQGNLTNLIKLKLKEKQTFSSDKNKLISFREESKTVIPEITQADKKEFMTYQEKYFDRDIIENYFKELEDTIKNIETNRKHLETDDNAIITQGMMINKNQLNKLLRDSDLERKAKDPKRVGKDIVNFARDSSTIALLASQFCIQLYAKQCSLFNKQVTALLKLIPEIRLN